MQREAEIRQQHIVNLIETAQDAIISFDENGIVNVWNESAENIFGYPKTEMIGQSVTAIIPEQYKKYYQKGLKRFLTIGEAEFIGKKVEISGNTKKGVKISIEICLSFHKTEEKEFSFVARIRDLTEQKKQEEKIYKLTCAVEQSPVTVIITDIKGNIEYVNPKFTQLTGYTLEEVLGQNPRILKTDKTSPAVFKELWETITSGKEWRGEM